MKYIVKVNGKTYELEVERVNDGTFASAAPAPMPAPRAAAPAPAPMPAPRAAAPAPAPAAPAPAPAALAAPAAAPAASAGATTIDAPMPGKVLKVCVTPGQAVKYGDCVIIMEAMKMETEIVAQSDGTVAQVLVKAGDNVDTGTALISMN